ncbi:patronin [Anabrus simplex]|uniref:patronin n=1 Tax=Anabrus simplex TaxID=316456 RepID=UPI0035A2AD48
MWSAISRFFTKAKSQTVIDNIIANDFSMDRVEDRRRITGDLEPQDTYDTRQAKQRASVKWLLSKAYNNRVPENLKEPFYRDHEDQEHLKPQIVHSLANAELYCLGLGNIYSDPNYHNLNHWGIIQALARKGVYVSEPPDAQLTETVLIQTTPLKLSAHMAVIEAMMVLYAKEVVTPDRVVAAIQRFSHSLTPSPVDTLPADHEEALVLWVNRACAALKQRIEQELDHADGKGDGDRQRAPDFPVVKEMKDLCDGVCLAALVSFYCPEELPWTDIVISYLPTVSDSVQNLFLVYNFCNRCLPSSVFHMMPEDVTYMQGSMKHNLTVFLADLFNVLEIHPVKCVRFPGTDRAHLKEVSKSSPTIQTSMPLKKSHSLQQADIHTRNSVDVPDRALSSDDRRNIDEAFVVHRGRGVPTLSSVNQAEEPLLPARLRPAKEKQNQDSKAEERGEPVQAAGRPSNWEESRRSSYAGRRSRRNSTSDDSQLTLENFGGSQENLHLLGRNPDKEPAVHIGRKQQTQEVVNSVVRTNAQECRSSGVELIFANNECTNEKQDEEKPTVSLRQVIHSREESAETIATSFAELSRSKSNEAAKSSIHIQYMQQHEREQEGSSNGTAPTKSGFLNKKASNMSNGSIEKKTTTFAALPNTTTWQQQSSSSQQQQQQADLQTAAIDDSNSNSHVMASQLHNIRMKLEEKRRRIESEKRRMEVVMNKQRQKVGKAAFLQAVTKGKNSYIKTPESDMAKDSNGEVETVAKPQRPFSLQEISEDVSSVEQKWLDNNMPFIEERRTPDIENMDLDQYQQSLAQMNSSLHEIQADIQRLATQQHQIQDMNHFQHQPVSQHQVLHSVQHQPQPQPPSQHQMTFQQQPQFYLHEQQLHRRTWGQPPQQQYPSHDMGPTYQWGDTQPSRHQQKMQPTSYNCQPSGGFVLHDRQGGGAFPPSHSGSSDVRYHNGDHHSLGTNHMPTYSVNNSSSGTYTSFQLHHGETSPGALFTPSATPPSASPQHRSSVHRISQMLGEPQSATDAAVDKGRGPGVMHAPIPTPPVDDMEPQSISFIGAPSGGPEDGLAQSIKGLQISSGSRTYRIPSPTRPAIARHSFQQQSPQQPQHQEAIESGPLSPIEDQVTDGTTEKGFYISFDNDSQPKRPKPPLRVKRSSPKKERPVSQYESASTVDKEEPQFSHTRLEQVQSSREPDHHSAVHNTDAQGPPGVGLVIGSELLNPDPVALDEMERKKERIMLLSLQRRQQQEEQKQFKEQEAQRRREMEKLKQEERERKKEEERLRRAAILEQYKLKKAIEEAEREGKLLPEKAETKSVPKMRNKSSTTTRPRPKTIHVDSGGVDLQDGVLSPSRSKKGSTSNLTDTVYNPPMRRDFYRGSQDSLAERMEDRGGAATSLFRDSPDDGRGASPCRSVNQLGRRGSYKTSRDVSEPGRVRGQQKYPTYQGNFRGRKSNSLMNLCGSSTDQDSMVYRYTDTDSGLGRATPPRRAPSPGMSSMRHLPSPSGPGSLPPGLMTKRRMFDDGSSDISSTPSSMMEYTGPRLYKQPATKSNRGIMLNAVEYCVFPGVVNKEAKRRVLEEIGRSESKHFLILFRDAGCQFRALYSYCPEREEVLKLYGTGPKQIYDRMFDKFFKYNSGGKCFSQVHTKHLTVTIDAFTIHNSLWQGKKVALPNKKDMPLVI